MSAGRLAGVLRVRTIQETRARGELGMSRVRHRQAAAAEQQTWNQLDERSHALAGHSITDNSTDDSTGDGSGLSSLVAAHAIAGAGILAAATQNRVTGDAADVVVIALDQWTVAARRVEALDRLHERLAFAEAEEQQRKSANEIDDLVLARFERQPEVDE